MRLKTAAFLLFLLLCGLFVAGTGLGALPSPPPWAYADFSTLKEAGLLPEYPAEEIAAGYSLSRYECALYLRLVLLRLGAGKEKDPLPASDPVGMAFRRLVEEFAPELGALGINVIPWSADGQKDESVYLDLDALLAGIAEHPEVPPAEGPPGIQAPGSLTPEPSGPKMALPQNESTYRTLRPESFSIPLPDFRKYPQSLLSLAGEVLGLEWTMAFSSGSSQEVLGFPLRLGGFVFSEENEKLKGGFGLRVGEEFKLGFDALWFLDLDEAQLAMNRLELNLNTQIPLKGRTGFFGGLSLEYRGESSPEADFGSQAIAGLRILLGGNLYLIAEYSLANPFNPVLPHLQGPSVGLSLGDIGLILLGVQTSTFVRPEDLEITGLFLYRF
ncbi:MAG: hypothetical protein ACUVRM_02260 [Bacillota bacterium]